MADGSSIRLPAMIGRIPILDVEPLVNCGRWPAKAVAGESFDVSATVFREGHEMLGAGVLLRDPHGNVAPLVHMRELVPGTDRHAAEVTVTEPGDWAFKVEAWGDPIAHWWHDAEIKVPRGQDVDLMMAEGARLFARAAEAVPIGAVATAAADAVAAAETARRVLAEVARMLADRTITVQSRLEAAHSPEIVAVLREYPLRELVSGTAWLPLRVHRERALGRLASVGGDREVVVDVDRLDADGLARADDPALHRGPVGLAVEGDLAPCQGATQGAVHSARDRGHDVIEGGRDGRPLRHAVVLPELALDPVDDRLGHVAEPGVAFAVHVLETRPRDVFKDVGHR
jgi:hypothetical protein